MILRNLRTFAITVGLGFSAANIAQEATSDPAEACIWALAAVAWAAALVLDIVIRRRERDAIRARRLRRYGEA